MSFQYVSGPSGYFFYGSGDYTSGSSSTSVYGSLGPHYGDFWGKATPRAKANLQKKVKREVQRVVRILEELPGSIPPSLQTLLTQARHAAMVAESSYTQVQELRQQLRHEVARQQRRRRQQHLLLVEL